MNGEGDDGLLLNFTSSGSKPKSRQKLSWNERRQKSRQQVDHTEPSKEPDSRIERLPNKKREKAPKRQANPEDRAPESFKRRKKETSEDHLWQERKELDGNTFLSSLFSSNPEVIESQNIREEDSLQKESSNAPLGQSNFQALDVNPKIVAHLHHKMAIEHPTMVQRAALPVLYQSDKDVVVVAETGSGKTLAYLLPILSRLMSQQNLARFSGVFAVIVAPTRELANQIYNVCELAGRCCRWLVPGLVIGGENKHHEKSRLRKGVNILIGTPGRIADHFGNTKALNLAEVRWVVLDEGDRLMELGFEETLTTILSTIRNHSRLISSKYSSLPSRCTHVLCSATMSSATDRLKTLALTSPIWVRETVEEQAPAQLQQQIVIVPAKLRLVTLAAYLKRCSRRVAVFFSCADSVDFHYALFRGHMETDETYGPATTLETGNQNIKVFRLHGSLSQPQRARTLAEFARSDGVSILCCTDVASRGLDVAIDHVVEYDPPFTVDDHLHRVGRTARAGKRGSAVLFLLPAEKEYAEKVSGVHGESLPASPYNSILSHGFGGQWQDNATTWHLNMERLLLKDESLHVFGTKAFTSHIRAYTTHSSEERKIFNLHDLHLGHLAKSFALRETPSELKSKGEKKKPAAAKPLSAKEAMLAAAKKHMATEDYNLA